MAKEKKSKKETRIVICEEVAIKEEEKKRSYYRYYEKGEIIFEPGRYVYKFNKEEGIISLLHIHSIVDEAQIENDEIEIREEDSFVLFGNKYVFSIDKEKLEEAKQYEVKSLKALLKEFLFSINENIFDVRIQINEERKKYLLRTFPELEQIIGHRNKQTEKRWIKFYNNMDLDFQVAVNLCILKILYLEIVEENSVITNIDKMALMGQCIDELDKKMSAIVPKGNARAQMDAPIGAISDIETKELIWNPLSKYEFRIEFFFFWNLVRNMLSLSYVPAVLVLLNKNPEAKIIIYFFLALIYMMAIVFSDEKQTDKLLQKINKGSDENEKKGYSSLYYGGMLISLTFIIFSIQLVDNEDILVSLTIIMKYLCADVVIAFVLLVMINAIISLIAVGATLFSATRLYQKKWGEISFNFKRIAKTFFWAIGLVCVYDIMSVTECLTNSKNINMNMFIRMWFFGVTAFVGIAKIIDIWKSREYYNSIEKEK